MKVAFAYPPQVWETSNAFTETPVSLANSSENRPDAEYEIYSEGMPPWVNTLSMDRRLMWPLKKTCPSYIIDREKITCIPRTVRIGLSK